MNIKYNELCIFFSAKYYFKKIKLIPKVLISFRSKLYGFILLKSFKEIFFKKKNCFMYNLFIFCIYKFNKITKFSIKLIYN